MDSRKVVVMLPNARRQTVKVDPNKTLLSVLEEACQKHDLSSNDYDLKHHNRILDLSQMFRFSGLPNNCLLEMVETTQKRKETDVVLCLQLEDGTRPQGTFKPSDSFEDILKELCADKIGPENNPVVIYMRKEIFGEALKNATLKSLGITGGRAMVRLVNKNPEDLKTQANVYVPVVKKSESSIEKPEPTREKSVSQNVVANPTTDLLKKAKEEVKAKERATSSVAMDVDTEVAQEEEKPPKKYEWGTSGNTLAGKRIENNTMEDASEEDDINDDDMAAIEAQICTLGDRNAVLFSLNEAQPTTDDLPDAFFELTVQDLQYLLRDLKRQAEDQNDSPLLTEKLRELENSKRVLNKLGQYKKSVIRVQFPNRLVLQGTFAPVDTIEAVHNFVKDYIQDQTLNFYLFTTPPKIIIPADQTLIEADCVPTAVLHFGSDDPLPDDILKPELLSKLTSPSGALLAASKSRGLAAQKRRPHLSPDENQAGPSTGAIPKQPKADSFKESSASQKPSGFVPKWFKPPGK